jgi:hypothetical protein
MTHYTATPNGLVPFTPEEEIEYEIEQVEWIAQEPERIKKSNKEAATSLLQATDWTCTVDITNPEYSNPYLMNQDAFLAYRSQVRAIAVNPPTTPAVFPEMPNEIWSS